MIKMLQKGSEEEEEHHAKDNIVLQTHKTIDIKFSGKVEKLKEHFAEVHLEISPEMSVDENGLIHNGFIFSGASLAATAAVNERYGFSIGAVVNFLTPVRQNDIVVFKAKSRQKLGRKRVVDVIGRVGDVKIFVGEFTVIVIEKHILSIRLDEIDVSEYDEDGFEN